MPVIYYYSVKYWIGIYYRLVISGTLCMANDKTDGRVQAGRRTPTGQSYLRNFLNNRLVRYGYIGELDEGDPELVYCTKKEG